MTRINLTKYGLTVLSASAALGLTSCATAQPAASGGATAQPMAAGGGGQKPNILFIMSDDIGWMQPSCYHQGVMVGETPNIDRIAREGGRFMTYYAEQAALPGATPSSPACIHSARA